jgi:uncharacterized protein
MSDWDVLDWRRRVSALYDSVRTTARTVGVQAAHDVWLSGRSALLRTHPASPLPPDRRDDYRDKVAPYDPAYRFVVPVEAAEPGQRQVQTGTDDVVTYRRVGRVGLADLGTLDAWWIVGYAGGLFLPMRDATSGTLSYGGGRYLLDTIKGADLGGVDDRLIVDLNFAYQPSCAYDESWACPLPGPENTLSTAVPVGELSAVP